MGMGLPERYYTALSARLDTIYRALGSLKQKRREPSGPRLSFLNGSDYFLQPEQDAQQSAEAQHVVLAAFTAPA